MKASWATRSARRTPVRWGRASSSATPSRNGSAFRATRAGRAAADEMARGAPARGAPGVGSAGGRGSAFHAAASLDAATSSANSIPHTDTHGYAPAYTESVAYTHTNPDRYTGPASGVLPDYPEHGHGGELVGSRRRKR